ncbi:hypothetical protein Tco_0975679 [Tanacetum coccineum]|uniref:Uncharacterized protein n=1 Tax=Tanacetum coccineum TaxID=301880 RepID=A0ABQ5EFC9_9ASTR
MFVVLVRVCLRKDTVYVSQVQNRLQTRTLVRKYTAIGGGACGVGRNLDGREFYANDYGVGQSVSPKRQCVRQSTSVASFDRGLQIPKVPTVGQTVSPTTCVRQPTPASQRCRRPTAIGSQSLSHSMSDAGSNGHSISIGGRYDDAIHVVRSDISSNRSQQPVIPVSSRSAHGLPNVNNRSRARGDRTRRDFVVAGGDLTLQQRTSGLPLGYKHIGSCAHSCQHCVTLFWYEERVKNTVRGARPRYNRCCRGGRVALRTYQIYPEYIKMLLEDRHFLENIRAYNQMFRMTSLGAHIDESINNGRGPYVFKIYDQLYHWIGSLCPAEGQPPRVLRRDVVEGLIDLLDTHNALVQLFRTEREKFKDTHIPNFKVRLYNVVGAREYELPRRDMLGAIVYETGSETDMDYDIVLEERSRQPLRIWYDEDVLDLRSVETKFPAIVFNDNLTSNETPSCEPTVSSFNDEIDFRISFDESDDEDYTTDSENYNEKVNKPLFPSPEPTASCIDDLDFFKDFENEFSAIVYNDALTSISMNLILKMKHRCNDDNKIDMIQSSRGNENTQGSNELLEESHDKINKVFIIKSFVTELNVNIVAWNYFVNEMLFNLIKNLYVPFGILFDPIRHMAFPPRNQRYQYLRYEGLQYTDDDIADFEARLTRIYRREVHKVHVFDFGGLLDLMAEGLSTRMLMEHKDAQGQSVFTCRAWRQLFDIRGPLVHELILEFFSTFKFGEAVTDLDTARALQFQLGGTVGFGAYGAESARQILDKGDLRDYWIRISYAGDFLHIAPSYTTIQDPILRLCHRLIACSIAGRSQAPKMVIVNDLFYLRGVDVGSVNVRYLLARYLRLFVAGRKSGAHISGGQFVARLAEHFGLLTTEILQGLTVIAPEISIIDMAELTDLAPVQAPPPPPPPAATRTMPQRMARLKEDVHENHRALTEQREVINAMARDFSRCST